MSTDKVVARLRPFEGLCLTAQDIADEQDYHRQNLYRHTLHLQGHGIVQGLTVTLQQRKGAYVAIVDAGFGITSSGQGILLTESRAVRLEVPSRDGAYMLWLFHVETPDEKSMRSVFDTGEEQSARIIEKCAPRLHPVGEDYTDAIALCRVNIRLSRMAKTEWPVPRASRRERAAESMLKPRVIEFITLNKKIVNLLLRTEKIREIELPTLSFNSALISAEFLLIEEGTTDRVLYRTMGSLISYAHDFYLNQPSVLKSIERFSRFIRQLNAEVPNPTQSNEVWFRWFLNFERILQPLNEISEELVQTIVPQQR